MFSLVELGLVVKDGATAHVEVMRPATIRCPSRTAFLASNPWNFLRRGLGSLAQKNRRSVGENASLQNRFREGISKWWPGVEFQGCAMKPRFVCKNYLGDDSDLHRQEIFVRNLNSLRIARHGCPEKLAARHFLLAAVLRRRWLIPVTMHRRHS